MIRTDFGHHDDESVNHWMREEERDAEYRGTTAGYFKHGGRWYDESRAPSRADAEADAL